MAKRSFKHFVEQELGKFPHFLIHAVLEWVLIIVLFIDGFLAFFANEFARFFELKIPCLLCTRIDHVVVHRNADFYYNDSICEAHKKNLSSLGFCHVHKKLSDVQKMCQACLPSFVSSKESDYDSYKSRGILHKDIDLFGSDEGSLPSAASKDGLRIDMRTGFQCSCCGDSLKVKAYAKSKATSLISHAPASSPRALSSPRAPFKTGRHEKQRSLESPRISYTELKFLDNESEHEEDGIHESHIGKQFREDVKSSAMALLTEGEEINGDSIMSPRGNKFFGIPLTDSAATTPRAAARLKNLQLDKTEFPQESEGCVSSGGDGELILQHLNRQVNLDKKSLMALYMELDEERSASAIAANNAMAMITRLQAEKASLQMEASQYQRMMEEQAEYEQEALQSMRELLVKREEEIKVLEAELDAYRLKYGNLEDEGFVASGDEIDKDYHEMKSQSFSVSPCYRSTKRQHNEEDVCNEESTYSSFNQSTKSSLHDETGEEKINKPSKTFLATKPRFLGRLKILDKTLQVADDGAPSSRSSSANINQMDEETEHDSKSHLMRELSQLHERVKNLEADGGFSKQGAPTFTSCSSTGSEREKVLAEISDNLEKLRHFITNPLDDDDDDNGHDA